MTEKQPNTDVTLVTIPEDDDTEGRTEGRVDRNFESPEPEIGGPKEDSTRYGTWTKNGKEVDF